MNRIGVRKGNGDFMTNIRIYDCEAEKLEKLAELNDTTVAEIIELLYTEHIEDTIKENGLKGV